MNDPDAIELFDADIHAPVRRRRSSAAEWRMSNASSVNSDDVPRQFHVQVQVERLSPELLNQSINQEPNTSAHQLRELRVSLEKLPEATSPDRTRRARSAGELITSPKDNPTDKIPVRKLSVQLKRLSTDGLEKSKEKSLTEISKEDVRKLKVSVEKLNLKRLKPSKKKLEDSDKVIAKAAEKIIMPPPHAPSKKGKSVSTPKNKKPKTPVTPEIEERNMLTSTPMTIVRSDDDFSVEISPVIDSDN